jgi:hypothetical protein
MVMGDPCSFARASRGPAKLLRSPDGRGLTCVEKSVNGKIDEIRKIDFLEE